MSTTTTRMTAAEYLAAGDGDERWTELIEGQIVVNEPKLIHAGLQAAIAGELYAWAKSRKGRGLSFTPTDVRMDDRNVYAPDVLWIAQKNLPLDLDGYPERVPDICVEIRSPSTWRYDLGAKKRVYEAGGLPELWLVDHIAGVVLVYRRSKPSSPVFDVELELGTGEALTSPQLPGFSLPLDDLFRH